MNGDHRLHVLSPIFFLKGIQKANRALRRGFENCCRNHCPIDWLKSLENQLALAKSVEEKSRPEVEIMLTIQALSGKMRATNYPITSLKYPSQATETNHFPLSLVRPGPGLNWVSSHSCCGKKIIIFNKSWGHLKGFLPRLCKHRLTFHVVFMLRFLRRSWCSYTRFFWSFFLHPFSKNCCCLEGTSPPCLFASYTGLVFSWRVNTASAVLALHISVKNCFFRPSQCSSLFFTFSKAIKNVSISKAVVGQPWLPCFMSAFCRGCTECYC